MKPSYTNERRERPATDQKFKVKDEHLHAENKEEVVKSEQGDELEPLVRQHPGNPEDHEQASKNR